MKKYNFALVRKSSLHSSLFIKFRGSTSGKKVAWVESFPDSGDKIVYIYPRVFQKWLAVNSTFNKKDEYFLSEISNFCFSYFDFFINSSNNLARKKTF